MSRRNPNFGRIVAAAVIAAGLAGTVIDPNGVVGVVLFSAAAAALLYLIARPIARLVGAGSRRVGSFSPRRVPLLVSPRTIIAIAFTGGALLGATNLFDANGDAALNRILNDATFLGGFMMIATIALVMLGTAVSWTRSAYRS
jgi:hypothetical protein